MMRARIYCREFAVVIVASGQYAPDVMQDLTNRAVEAFTAAAASAAAAEAAAVTTAETSDE
jgi:hypothetical protein